MCRFQTSSWHSSTQWAESSLDVQTLFISQKHMLCRFQTSSWHSSKKWAMAWASQNAPYASVGATLQLPWTSLKHNRSRTRCVGFSCGLFEGSFGSDWMYGIRFGEGGRCSWLGLHPHTTGRLGRMRVNVSFTPPCGGTVQLLWTPLRCCRNRDRGWCSIVCIWIQQKQLNTAEASSSEHSRSIRMQQKRNKARQVRFSFQWPVALFMFGFWWPVALFMFCSCSGFGDQVLCSWALSLCFCLNSEDGSTFYKELFYKCTNRATCFAETVCTDIPTCVAGIICTDIAICFAGFLCTDIATCFAEIICTDIDIWSAEIICTDMDICFAETICSDMATCVSETICTDIAICFAEIICTDTATCFAEIICTDIAVCFAGFLCTR